MSFNSHTSSQVYRSDIDGLRAIAVFAVVFFHAIPKAIPGGFIGVDVFFVISGYLITNIICKNIQSDFSFIEFYKRRVKRIFPALIVVITACLIFGWFVLDASSYMRLGIHSQASALFYTNFALTNEAGYFDVASNSKPLLHLWSLAIEEQFYILWPFLLYYIHKKGLNQISFYIFVILISFTFNIIVTKNDPTKAFFWPFGRAWELISGGLVAYLSTNKIKTVEYFKLKLNSLICAIIYEKNSQHSDDGILQNTLSILGLCTIAYCIIYFKKSHFPGWKALAPVVSTIFIIAAGPKAWVNKKLLSNKVLVWFGLISYPLYLWHWPIISFISIIEDHQVSRLIIYGAILLSIFLAWLTYILIEKPIRFKLANNFIIFILYILLLTVGLFGYYINTNNGLSWRDANKSQIEFAYLHEIFNDKTLMEKKNVCNQIFDTQSLTGICFANSEKPKFLALGDSHALPIGYGAISLNQPDILMIIRFGYLPFTNYITYRPSTDSKDDLIMGHTPFIKYLKQAVSLSSVEYVVLANRGPVYFSGTGFGIELLDTNLQGFTILPIKESKEKISSQEAFVEGYVELINFLLSNGKKVIFFIDVPEIGFDPRTCEKKPITITKKQVHDCTLERKAVDERQKEYRQLIAEIKKRTPKLMVYDPTDAFCDLDKCYAKKNGTILYSDDDHLNSYGTKILIDDFNNWLKKQEQDSSGKYS